MTLHKKLSCIDGKISNWPDSDRSLCVLFIYLIIIFFGMKREDPWSVRVCVWEDVEN